MQPFRPHRAGETPFYATMGPIRLLDVLHEKKTEDGDARWRQRRQRHAPGGCREATGGRRISPQKKRRPNGRLVFVEIVGVEPTTLCLQSRCSSQLSYTPFLFFFECLLRWICSSIGHYQQVTPSFLTASALQPSRKNSKSSLIFQLEKLKSSVKELVVPSRLELLTPTLSV